MLLMAVPIHKPVLNWNPNEERSVSFDVRAAHDEQKFVHVMIRQWKDEYKFIFREAHREKDGHGFGWCYVFEIPEKIRERNIELSRLHHALSNHILKKEQMSMEMNRKCKDKKNVILCSCKSCTKLFNDLYQTDVKISVMKEATVVIQDIISLLNDIYNKPNVSVAF